MTTFNKDLVNSQLPSNRATENQMSEKSTSVTLKSIDTAIIEHLTNTIKPTVERDSTQIAVPVIYGNPEKWKSAQKDGVFRDHKGRVQTPMIMIHRTGIVKNEEMASPVNKHLTKSYETGWNKRVAYDKFNVLNGILPSREIQHVVLPDYIKVTYELTIWTEYTEQMNAVIEQINFETDEYWGDNSSYKFKASIGEYTHTQETPSTEDRIVKSTCSIEVQAYLLPERMRSGETASAATTQKSFTSKKIIAFVEAIVKSG